MSFHTNAQRLKDSTTLPNNQIRLLLKLVKQGEDARYELKEKDAELKQMDSKNIALQISGDSLNNQFEHYKLIHSVKELDLRIQNANLLIDRKSLQRKLYLQKRKTTASWIIDAAAFIGLLIIK